MPKRYRSDLDACKPAQLLALLQLASKQENTATVTRTGAAGTPQLRTKLSELCTRTGYDGAELLERAAHPESSVEQLREVVSSAQTLSAEAADEQQWQAASFLYHLAIAAALVRHHVDLSTRTLNSRVCLYEDFASSLLEDPLGEIFRDAADRARTSY
jgi:hypothetical protein